jgi:hypothetical protein
MAQGTAHILRLEHICVYATELCLKTCCGKDLASQKADAGHTDFFCCERLKTPVQFISKKSQHWTLK